MAGADDDTRAGVPSGGEASAGRRVYADRYCVNRVLGRGGMGEVFHVRDTQTGTDAALKILHAAPDDTDQVERFKREIGVLARITHPAVPRILDWGVDRGQIFFVSEFVDGHDLRTELQRRGALPAADAARLVAEVADVLAAAHAAGIIHRDVKPSNIMIDRSGAVRLLDFGLARATGVDTTTLTKTGMIVGTPTYMSPEQFDNLWVDERSDVYSLGVVLFEMLAGRPPFSSATVIGIGMMHKSDLPPAPGTTRSDVPTWIDRVVLKCLEKRPEKRFATAAALASELRRPRSPQLRRLPSGDVVVEDGADLDGWALVLKSSAEKSGWSTGIVLYFYERYYKLQRIVAPETGTPEWTYLFTYLPQTEVIRKLVDYREDCGEQQRQPRPSLLKSVKGWMTPRK